MGLIEKKRKALFIKGFFNDVEKLIKVAKSEAAKMGMKGRIAVLDIGHYNPLLNGQAVVVEEAGSEYNAQGGRSKSQEK
ncbi:MAG: hypothetical protein QXQ94_11350 [Candidatus Bathyarchaeia archaeon]